MGSETGGKAFNNETHEKLEIDFLRNFEVFVCFVVKPLFYATALWLDFASFFDSSITSEKISPKTCPAKS